MHTVMVMNQQRQSWDHGDSPLVRANYNRAGGRAVTHGGEVQPQPLALDEPSPSAASVPSSVRKKTRFNSLFENSTRVRPFSEDGIHPLRGLKSMGSNIRSRLTTMSRRFGSIKPANKDQWSMALLKAANDSAAHKNGWLIDPRSFHMRSWDVVTSICLLFTALVTPYEVSFLTGGLNALFWINRTVDLVFFIDMFLQFFLIYYDETDDLWVQDHQKICWSYARSWFLIDLVSIFPFDILGIVMQSSAINKLKIIRIIKLLRLAKLLRVLRAGRIFQRLETQINISYKNIQLMTFAIGVALCAHWMACALQLNTIIEECPVDNYLDGKCINWIYYYNNNGGNGVLLEAYDTGHLKQQHIQTGELLELDDEGYSVSEEGESSEGYPIPRLVSVYWTAVYWAVMTMSTIGYGDVTPQTDGERVYVTIGMILGAAIYAYMVGNVCSIIASMSASEQRFRQEMDVLNSFLNANYVPQELKDELRAFYRYRNSNVTMSENQEVLRSLTPKLQAAVAQYTQASWLRRTDLFTKFPGDMVVELYLSMRPEAYVPGEEMVAEGTACDHLFITERGLVWYRGKVFGRPSSRSGGAFAEKSSLAPRGVWIGTHDMMSKSGLHRYSAYSLTYTVVLSMRREVLETQLSRFPSVKLAFRRDLVRSLMKECVRLYAQAFRRLQSADDIMCLLFRPNAGTMHQDNWIMKHKFKELLDLVAFRLGPENPISKRIAAVKKAATIIQSAFRGFQSRKRLLAKMRYSDFVVATAKGLAIDVPRISTKVRDGWRGVRVPRQLFEKMSDELATAVTVRRPLEYNPGRLTPEPVLHDAHDDQDSAAVQSSPHFADLDMELRQSPSKGGKSAGPVQPSAADPQYRLIKKLSRQMDHLQHQLSTEINDVKRMVRDIIVETSL